MHLTAINRTTVLEALKCYGLLSAIQRPTLVLENGKKLQGIRAIAWYLASTINGDWVGRTAEEQALVKQWLEFSSAFSEEDLQVSHICHNFLLICGLTQACFPCATTRA